MKRAVLAMVLAACSSGVDDFPARPGGGGPVVGGPGGSGGDAGIRDGADGDAGVLIAARVCVITDLRKLTACAVRSGAPTVSVTLGTRIPTAPPTDAGDFTIFAQLGTDLVWRASGANFVTTVMPFGPEHVIPIVSDTVYTDLLVQNDMTALPEGQGSVVARVVRGVAEATGVTATTTLVSANVIPRYDEDKSAVDWNPVGPTQMAGVLWFPGVNVTTTSTITFVRPDQTLVPAVGVTVEDQAITFVTQDVQ
jgi:hypothetical protein